MHNDLSTHEPTTNRIEAFTDAVLAIVITLMVLEIKIPEMEKEISASETLHQMWPLLPKLMAYALSFIMIAIFWVNHHQLLSSIRVSTQGLLWVNNVWLFWICLLPFPTAFLGEHATSALAVLLFGSELFLCSLSFYFVRKYCFQKKLFRSTVPANDSKQFLRRSALGPILYLASMVAAFVSIYLAYALFTLVPVLFFLSSINQIKK